MSSTSSTTSNDQPSSSSRPASSNKLEVNSGANSQSSSNSSSPTSPPSSVATPSAPTSSSTSSDSSTTSDSPSSSIPPSSTETPTSTTSSTTLSLSTSVAEISISTSSTTSPTEQRTRTRERARVTSSDSSISTTTTATEVSSSSLSGLQASQVVLVTQVPSSSFGSLTPLPDPVSSTAVPSFTNNENRVGSTSNGFWSNKKTVAGTFTALALLFLGLGFGVVLFLMKKRRRRDIYNSDRDTFFNDKYPPEPGLVSISSPEPHQSTRSALSVSDDLHRTQPMDTSNREHHNYQHQNADPFADSQTARYPNGSLPEITYSYARDAYNQYPSYDYDSSSNDHSSSALNPLSPAPQSYFYPLDPKLRPVTNASLTSSSNPFRDLPSVGASGQTLQPGRDSAVPSVDSFYGPNTNLGYAR